MPEEEGFHNRPFAGLGAQKRAQPERESDKDRDLFLAALKRMKPAGTQKGGFALETLCAAWPKIQPLKMSGRRKKKTPPPEKFMPVEDPNLAAQQADGPGQALPPDEDEFLVAMRSVRPLEGRGRAIARKPPQIRQPIAELQSFEDSVEKSMEFALYSSDEYLEGHVVGLDDLIVNSLREGRFSPEDHLDLHGLNAEQAWESLRVFMRQAWFKGLRCVLLVPGRGRNSPMGQGVLRGKLQTWLTQEPFKRVVLAFCTARPHDGGAGGVYVLLRRSRKKGRIHWERLPSDADLYKY